MRSISACRYQSTSLKPHTTMISRVNSFFFFTVLFVIGACSDDNSRTRATILIASRDLFLLTGAVSRTRPLDDGLKRTAGMMISKCCTETGVWLAGWLIGDKPRQKTKDTARKRLGGGVCWRHDVKSRRLSFTPTAPRCVHIVLIETRGAILITTYSHDHARVSARQTEKLHTLEYRLSSAGIGLECDRPIDRPTWTVPSLSVLALTISRPSSK